MSKGIERIEIDGKSDLARRVFESDIDFFRACARVTVALVASMKGFEKDDLLSMYDRKNTDMCQKLVEEIANRSDDIYDQLIHFAMATVTLAFNFHGCYEYLKGEVEIQELLGDIDEHE